MKSLVSHSVTTEAISTDHLNIECILYTITWYVWRQIFAFFIVYWQQFWQPAIFHRWRYFNIVEVAFRSQCRCWVWKIIGYQHLHFCYCSSHYQTLIINMNMQLREPYTLFTNFWSTSRLKWTLSQIAWKLPKIDFPRFTAVIVTLYWCLLPRHQCFPTKKHMCRCLFFNFSTSSVCLQRLVSEQIGSKPRSLCKAYSSIHSS